MDANFYLGRAQSWIDGNGFYQPWQLTGQTYVVENGGATYPPTILLLLAPFAIGVPMILWWAVPLTLVGFSLIRLRPAIWVWPVLALTLVYPRTWVVVALGNPSMWVFAAVATGLVWRWPFAFVVLKPTFAPLALFGIRARGWWISIAILCAVSLPFASMWIDYIVAIAHAESPRGIEYLLGEWPIAISLLAAYVARDDGAPLRRASSQLRRRISTHSPAKA